MGKKTSTKIRIKIPKIWTGELEKEYRRITSESSENPGFMMEEFASAIFSIGLEKAANAKTASLIEFLKLCEENRQ